MEIKLFFFFNLSSRDVNSSSELADSSNLEGAESVRLGEANNVGVLWGGRKKGDVMGCKGVNGEPASSSCSTKLILLAFEDLGFEWRVLQVLLTTISSSSLSLTKTGESQWDNGLLNGWWVTVEVLLFLGTAKQWSKIYIVKNNVIIFYIYLHLLNRMWRRMRLPFDDDFVSINSSSDK